MQPHTIILIEKLIRLGKGMLSALEEWLVSAKAGR